MPALAATFKNKNFYHKLYVDLFVLISNFFYVLTKQTTNLVKKGWSSVMFLTLFKIGEERQSVKCLCWFVVTTNLSTRDPYTTTLLLPTQHTLWKLFWILFYTFLLCNIYCWLLSAPRHGYYIICGKMWIRYLSWQGYLNWGPTGTGLLWEMLL